MKDREKIIQKIKKCLALSTSSNATEAATALRQAQSLAEEYDISSLDVDAAGASMFESGFKSSNKPTVWEANLAVIIARAFSCQSAFQHSVFGCRWLFIGTGVNPELAGYAQDVLYRQLKKDRSKYIKEKLYRCKRKNKTARADMYCESWVNRVADTVKEFAPNQEQQKAIDAFIQKHHSNSKELKGRRRKSNGSADSKWADYSAGSKDGAKAKIHHGVNSEKQSLIGESK